MQNLEKKGERQVRMVVKRTDRLLITWEILVCAIFLAGGLLISRFVYAFEEPLRFALGIALGCASSVIKIILLNKSLQKSVDMDKKSAASREKLHALGRYGVTGAAIVLAVIFPGSFGIIGLVIGILSLQLAALIASRYPMSGDKYDAKGNKLHFHSKKS